MKIRILGIVVVCVALALAVSVGVASYWPPEPASRVVQAHEDGTNHIHPTPTPTPYPALGLAGQVSLHSELYYRESNHTLEVTTVVHHAPPPPDGWQFRGAYWHVSVQYQGWSFSSACQLSPWQPSRGDYENGVATCQIPLPDYADFGNLSEPMLVNMQAGVEFNGDNRPGDIDLSETLYVDLFDRSNWK